MASYRFLMLDVFSDAPFGGNQLAVLPDATGISDDGLQTIAREFNFPESTFVFLSADPDCIRRVRIFTPRTEMPFAGHPTVGTACALVAEGLAAEGRFQLEEGIGPIEVEVSRSPTELGARLTARQAPQLNESVGRADAAAVLGLTDADVVQVFAATLGIGFTFVQLRDPTTVDRAALDYGIWSSRFAGKPNEQIYLFAGELADGAAIHSRMFAPALGIAEDPATGAAASILAGAAATITGARGDRFSLTIDQGVAMGRPSRLEASAFLEAGAVTAVSVGGASTFVAEGRIDVPEKYLLD
jgi:trans-2,3-dihydro-3-hydroxyanthranilate isomerase